jgi:hypothetical protein
MDRDHAWPARRGRARPPGGSWERAYHLLGSPSRTVPAARGGPGKALPLNDDAYLMFTLVHARRAAARAALEAGLHGT